jgi:predicted aminopeptidase
MESGTLKHRIRLAVVTLIIVAIPVLMSQLTACASPAYYWQAASGHLALMHARQPVDEAIERSEAGDEVVAKLRLSREIKAFAVNDLGLPANDSYEEFVRTDRDAVVWNVIAAPEFSLHPKTWCFPVAGCVPYRGYFEQEKAERFAAKLEQRQLDVTVSPATAYSTLGWFDDPLLDTMWRYSDAQFAAYLFHEIAHQALYIKDDAAFNESYASFVEDIGVERWLRQRGEDEALERWLDLSEARAGFNALLQTVREDLQAIYTSGATPEDMRARKQQTLDHMQSQYQDIREQDWQGRDYFGRWFDTPPNNARFALLDTYEGGTCAFAALYREAGGDMTRFHALAKDQSELPAPQRSEWLEQPCPNSDIARTAEL